MVVGVLGSWWGVAGLSPTRTTKIMHLLLPLLDVPVISTDATPPTGCMGVLDKHAPPQECPLTAC